MIRYRYIGLEEFLKGETALGKWGRGLKFYVQVDRFDHEWSHGWWLTDADDWEGINGQT